MPELRHHDVRGRQMAYRLRLGASPTLVFLSGYASDMEGTKALALDAFAAERGIGMLRFDYSGTGSSGGRFDEGTLELWLEEALAALDELTDGPVILVGSSMGGWIALHLALRRGERVRGLVGIAAAPDFTEWGFGEQARGQLVEHGRIGTADPDGRATPQLMTLAFWESGQSLRLLEEEVAVDCPVRLIHGDADHDVPLDTAFRTMRQLRSPDVQLKVIKRGGHRLSEPHEIAAILSTVDELLVERAPIVVRPSNDGNEHGQS